MKKMAGYSREENLADAAGLAAMLRAIHDCGKPVVARVQGDCYAGGMGLATACDIVVAAEAANFCLSEVKLGLIPATISPYVIRAMGAQAARRYFITAERFSAAAAQRMGLVHECVPADALDDTVAALLKSLLAASPDAVAAAKRLVNDVAGQALTEALVQDTVVRIADIRASEQGREGVRSFLEKRKPSWLE
jgi:methylglutaconyl-CoA hydratase